MFVVTLVPFKCTAIF